jgi:hypothetical protein
MIGHSSGAIAISNEMVAGTFDDAVYVPAYAGLIDQKLGEKDLDGHVPSGGPTIDMSHTISGEDITYAIPTAVTHFDTGAIDEISGVKNTYIKIGWEKVANIGAHFDIVKREDVIRALAQEATAAYIRKLAMEIEQVTVPWNSGRDGKW